MPRCEIHIKETHAVVIAEKSYIPVAEAEIRRQRKFIEDYIAEDPVFFRTLTPHSVRPDAPEIIRRMADAAAKVDVGPMAAVAGAIAEFALKAVLAKGAEHAIIDNGGDIAMALARPATVGIFTGPSKIRDIGLYFQPCPGIIGICTSSGTVGHSLSFGRADAAVVIAKDVCLADAAATALGNAVQDKDPDRLREAMTKRLENGVDGMLVIVDDVLAICGEIPEIVSVRTEVDKISKGAARLEKPA
jgi:ApbE superfamily uncharacterized protein (UPF0280 family)